MVKAAAVVPLGDMLRRTIVENNVFYLFNRAMYEYGFINTIIFGFFTGYFLLLIYWFYQKNFERSWSEVKPKHFIIYPLVSIGLCLFLTKKDDCPSGEYEVFSKGRVESYVCK